MMSSAGALVWHRNNSVEDPRPKPIVLLLSWMWASPALLSKYVQLYHRAGWDVAVYRTPAASIWVPAYAAWCASSVLKQLSEELQAFGPRPVVAAVFSGAAKGIYAHMLQALEPFVAAQLQPSAASHAGAPAVDAAPQRWWWPRQRPPSPAAAAIAAAVAASASAAAASAAAARAASPLATLAACLCGSIYDSGPVDFTSELGARLAAQGRPAVVLSAATLVSSTMDFCALEYFERQRAAMWATLTTSRAAPRHSLLLYSWSDPMVEGHQLRRFAHALRDPAASAAAAGLAAAAAAAAPDAPVSLSLGGPPCAPDARLSGVATGGRVVLEQGWEEGGHVALLRDHPQRYEEMVAFFLSEVQLRWRDEAAAVRGAAAASAPAPAAYRHLGEVGPSSKVQSRSSTAPALQQAASSTPLSTAAEAQTQVAAAASGSSSRPSIAAAVPLQSGGSSNSSSGGWSGPTAGAPLPARTRGMRPLGGDEEVAAHAASDDAGSAIAGGAGGGSYVAQRGGGRLPHPDPQHPGAWSELGSWRDDGVAMAWPVQGMAQAPQQGGASGRGGVSLEQSWQVLLAKL